jgi:hypothetical protein
MEHGTWNMEQSPLTGGCFCFGIKSYPHPLEKHLKNKQKIALGNFRRCGIIA